MLAQQVDLAPVVGLAETLAQLSGPTLILVLVVMLARRDLVWGSDVKTVRKDAADRLAAHRHDAEARLDEMRRDRDWWRDAAASALQLGEAAVARDRPR